MMETTFITDFSSEASTNRDHEEMVGVYHTIGEGNQEIINPNRSRPLPEPPQQFDICDQEKQRSSCRKIFMAPILLVLVVFCSSVVYMRLSCYKGWLCAEKGRVSRVSEHPCDAQSLSDYNNNWNSTCDLDLFNATALLLQSPKDELFTYELKDSYFNVTIKGMLITLSRQPENLSVDIEIQEVNCSTAGSYNVTLTNETYNETYKVNIKVNPTTQQCPCSIEFNAGRNGLIQCMTSPGVNLSVTLRAHNSEKALVSNVSLEYILKIGSIEVEDIPHGSIEAVQFGSQTWMRLIFSPVTCALAGTFVIELGDVSYETVFTVQSYPRIPTIGVDHDELGGLVEWYKGEVRCAAFVGCGQPPTMYEKILDTYKPIAKEGLRSSNQTLDDGITYFEGVAFNHTPRIFNGSQFMCSFTSNGKTYKSEIYTVFVIPSNYCYLANISMQCNGKHPYDCGKFISCTVRPYEQICPEKLQFYFPEGSTCQGQCGYPKDANCKDSRIKSNF